MANCNLLDGKAAVKGPHIRSATNHEIGEEKP
jgi:hypothetical protein